MPIVLHHCVDARSLRPLWMLEELGLPYDLRMLPFPPRALAKAYLDVNALGTVPALQDGEVFMTESVAMVQYLAARHAPGGLDVAVHEADHAHYLNFLHFGEATLTFPQTLVLRYAQLEPPERRQPQVAQDYAKWFLARLKAVEVRLLAADYLAASRFTAADVSVGYALWVSERLGLSVAFSPRVKAYALRLFAREAFQRALRAQTAAALAQGVSERSPVGQLQNVASFIPAPRPTPSNQTRMPDATPKPPYLPPKVWVWNKPNGGHFASTNRPIAGATHESVLPVGKHPLQLYSLGTPNGVKVTIMLEELLALGHQGAEYDAWLIDIQKGDQFGSGFVAVNPNSKIPALMDHRGPEPVRVFESGAILLHLADAFSALIPPAGSAARTECLSWLFWQMGSAPYLGGGFGHFYAYAPEKFEYPIDRFAMEVKRQLDVLDRRLADNTYLNGDEYSIADIAVWPWYGSLVLGWAYGAAEFLSVHEYVHVQRWAQAIAKRPAVQRGRMVNRRQGELSSQLHERHDARDFETRTQDKL